MKTNMTNNIMAAASPKTAKTVAKAEVKIKENKPKQAVSEKKSQKFDDVLGVAQKVNDTAAEKETAVDDAAVDDATDMTEDDAAKKVKYADPLGLALSVLGQPSDSQTEIATETETAAEAVTDEAAAAALDGVQPKAAKPVQQAEIQTAANGVMQETQVMPADIAVQSAASQQAAVSLEALLPLSEENASQADQDQQLMNLLAGKNNFVAEMPQENNSVLAEMTQQVQGQNDFTAAEMAEVKAGTEPAVLMTVANNMQQTESKGRETAVDEVKANPKGAELLRDVQVEVVDKTAQQQSNAQQENPSAEDEQPKLHQELAEMKKASGEANSSAVGTKVPTAEIKQTAETGGESQQTVNPAGVSANSPSFAESMKTAAAENVNARQMAEQADIPKQIVEQARLIKTVENTQMVIKLKPEHLGELTLRISVSSNGSVNASFHSDNAQVRGIIENSMVQLKQELQQQGLKVDNVGVYAGLSEDFFSSGHQQGQQQLYQQEQVQVRSQKADAAAFAEESENSAVQAAQNETTVSDGVDYRV